MLAIQGQVTYRPQRGYWVAELAPADLDEIFLLRARLEPPAVARTLALAQEPRPQNWDSVAAFESASAAGALAELVDASRDLHFGVFAGPTTRHAAGLIESLWNKLDAYLGPAYGRLEPQVAVKLHRQIAAAADEADADATIGAVGRLRDLVAEALGIGVTPADR